MYKDFSNIIESYELPYWDFLHLLLSDMTCHLIKHIREAVIVGGVVIGLVPNREVKGMRRCESWVLVSEVGAAVVDELELKGRYCVLGLYMRDIQSLVGLKEEEKEMKE
ncbi:hypothetical protein F4604DRAFT_1674125 [Suillus subluteus]|nr:hypothetical protein F4604DRAFT_1674125 [Suillus subluteus]